MAIVTIKIVDENPQRYTLRPNTLCLGRMYDNIAEGIQVIFPSYELANDSSCTMIVYANGTQIDSISVSSGVPFDIRDNLSEYKNVEIGFVFEKANGYTKNSESKCFYFADALKPIAFTPSDPTQHSQINFLLGNAFVDVKWSDSERNTLEFLNLSGGIVQSIELSPFVQEQADLAETNIDSDSYVKNKSTIYLVNEGANGTSPYAEIADLPTKTSDLQNDGDGESPFATLNDLPTNTSDLQNDGDGESPFATQSYVATYGGKIDELYLNDVYQQIVNKKVYLTVNKNTVGLGDVDNTSDADKPVSTAQQQAISAVANSIGSGIITITQGGEPKGTFSVNQSSNQTIELDAGGSGETIDYESLDNKPSINSITLVGNLSSSDLGLATAAQGSLADTALQPSDVDNSLNDASENPVQNKVLAVLIPSDASSSNQLTTKDFVNSSIATNTANFIGTFSSVSALNAYSGTVTNNDYAFVVNSVVTDNGNDWPTFTALDAYDKTLLTNFDYAWVINSENPNKFDLYRFDIVEQQWDLRAQSTHKDDVTLNNAFNRYKATVVGSTTTWDYEYTLNNSSFTASQWATINSGLTSADKNKLDGIESGAQVNTIQTISVDNVAITPVDKNINIDLSGKLDKITSTGLNRVYGISSLGDQTIFNVDDSLSNWSLARRNGSGNIRVATSPTNSNDATSKDYVDNKVVALSGIGAPTTSTAGFIGQIYIDTTNNKTYQCTAITTESDTTTYTWVQLIRATDYATQDTAGAVKINAGYGIKIFSNGTLAMQAANNNGITAKSSDYYPIVPATLDFAVKVGVTTNVNNLTDTEKTNAQTWLGLNTLYGSSAPTTSTVGRVGQIYLDTTNNKTYQCVAVTGDGGNPEVFTYTWVQLIRATDYATSTNVGLVKSQNAVANQDISIQNDGSLTVRKTDDLYFISNRDAASAGYYAMLLSIQNINAAVKYALIGKNRIGYKDNVQISSDSATWVKPLTVQEQNEALSIFGAGRMETLTQAQYDALVSGGTVDTNTYYFIEEE